mgnify:CR=1 FL=1
MRCNFLLKAPRRITRDDVFEGLFIGDAAQPASALLNLAYVEEPAANAPAGAASVQGNISLVFTGSAPNLQVSYFLQTEGNFIPLSLIHI